MNEVATGDAFPRLRAGTFIEAHSHTDKEGNGTRFPRLRAGTFIEAGSISVTGPGFRLISPPSGGDFH